MNDNGSQNTFWAGRNINGYFAFHLFINFAFWLPVYAVFFVNRGLLLSELLSLFAVLGGVQTVLEIPSGTLADRWGRKPILVLGALLQGCGYVCIAAGNSFFWYFVGMALAGTALAFISGADAAFIYDSLAAAGRENEFKKIEGQAYMYNLLGWGAGGLLGGYVAVHSLSMTYILSALTSVLALLCIGLCEEPPHTRGGRQSLRLLKKALVTTGANANVRATVILASVVIGLLLVVHKFSQPYLVEAGFPLKSFGYVYFLWLAGAAAAARYSEQIERFLGRQMYFISVPLVAGTAILYMGLWQNVWGAVLALGHQYAWGSLRPQVYQIINGEVDSSMRATVLSMTGFGSSVFYIICVPVFGLVADKYGFAVALQILGPLLAVLGLIAAIFLLASERKKSPRAQESCVYDKEK